MDNIDKIHNDLSSKETFSNADGQESVDSYLKLYTDSMTALAAIDKSIIEKQSEIESIKTWLNTNVSSAKISNPSYQPIANMLSSVQSSFDTLKADVNSCKNNKGNKVVMALVSGAFGTPITTSNINAWKCNSGKHDKQWVPDRLTELTQMYNNINQLKSQLLATPQTLDNADYSAQTLKLSNSNTDLLGLEKQRSQTASLSDTYKGQLYAARQTLDSKEKNNSLLKAAYVATDAIINKAQSVDSNLQAAKQESKAKMDTVPEPAIHAKKSVKTKGQLISGISNNTLYIAGVALVGIVIGFIGYKKGWFNGKK